MQRLAVQLNKILEKTIAYSLLSDLGRSLYFPKGVVAQSAEAGRAATLYNASVGMATLRGNPIFLTSMKRYIPDIAAHEIFAYAPTAGIPELRTLWKNCMIQKNPALKQTSTSLPIVCSGISHAVSVAADLFVENGDSILLPELFWGNYKLIFETRKKANLIHYPLFEKEKLNLKSIREKLQTIKTEKIILVLNFPHNPTGYTPTQTETHELAHILLHTAQNGKQLAIIVDDAYFGLFYEQATFKQSLFGLLSNLHENILAIKVDGATKEDLSWGLRIGFITLAAKSLQKTHYSALEKKVMGALRSSISSCNRLSQSLLLNALQDSRYETEKQDFFSLLKERYLAVKKIIQNQSSVFLTALPFNSGYFLTFQCHNLDAEQLRVYLLTKMGIGTVAIPPNLLRVAYSSIDTESIPDFFEKLWSAAEAVAEK